MKKALFAASTLSHIQNFHLPYLRALGALGWEIWVAVGAPDDAQPVLLPEADQLVLLPLRKQLLSPQNLRAIFAARRLLRAQQFDLVSVHTTLAAAVVRAGALLLAAEQRPPLISVCHGYLFGQAGGLKRLLYLLPEKLCARVTSRLLVMNREDEQIAQRNQLCAAGIYYINGMGLDTSRLILPDPQQRQAGRAALGFSADTFLFVYAAEFSHRKNQQELIRAFAAVAPQIPHAKLLLAGKGALLERCKHQVQELGIQQQILFPGYLSMREVYPLCDAAVSSSRIEGMPFNLMEALAFGLPVVASDIKGHRDLLAGCEGSWLYQGGQQLEKALVQAATKQKPPRQSLPEQYTLEAVLPQVMTHYLETAGEL